jgi:2-keto-4-pentenoate hydratase
MRRIPVLALVTCALAGAGCGDDAKVDGSETSFERHAGLALGTLTRHVLQPYQEGTFERNADGRRSALAKAARAGARATDEVRLARGAASSSDALRPNLIAPLDALSEKLEPLVEELEAGDAISAGSVLGAAAAAAELKTTAAAQGLDIQERSAPIPGA